MSDTDTQAPPAEAAPAKLKTYAIQSYWTVLRGRTGYVEAESPEAAMAELERLCREEDWESNNREFDNSDGPSTFVVWDKDMTKELLTSDPGDGVSKFSDRELGTILAALRYWQREGLRADPEAELRIASDDETIEPLTAEEIDGLCERLNTREADPVREAAPDLLAACRLADGVLTGTGDFAKHSAGDVVLLLRAAIAKAEGRAS